VDASARAQVTDIWELCSATSLLRLEVVFFFSLFTAPVEALNRSSCGIAHIAGRLSHQAASGRGSVQILLGVCNSGPSKGLIFI